MKTTPKNTELIFTEIDNQILVWFQNSNRYVILEKNVFKVIHKIKKQISKEAIILWISETFTVEKLDAKEILKHCTDLLQEIERKEASDIEKKEIIPSLESQTFYSEKQYKINDNFFKIQYDSEKSENLIHSKLEHLNTEKNKKIDYHHFQIIQHQNRVYLFENKHLIDSWKNGDYHYFHGKLSMLIINQIHHKKESDWLGIFHASAISDGENSMLFMGDSGNGKSTLSALLMTEKLYSFADDFVPILRENLHVYNFPVGISIKEKSIPVLENFFPKLATKKAFYINSKKTVRYQEPSILTSKNYPCKAFVFVKYDANIEENTLEEMSKIEAFQKIVPESWLYDSEENAEVFLDFFKNTPCYNLVYSDNSKMISIVKNLFQNA
ncbi:hypothetical protein [Aureivirga sp. CE67]|uniref:hypothetical protein n=1 Tax=Aureivirga sp. CE67 TaxID=1788983 RepID=UPI0018C99F32|nr:hypothetical protein [Aureivirga sp. CE67]